MQTKPTYEELKQRVKELEQNEARKRTLTAESHKSVYRSMLENISDTVIVTDDYGFIIYVCPNTAINFGLSVDEVHEFGTIDKLMNGKLCRYSDLYKKREIPNIEWSITHHPSGEKRHLLVTAKSINIFGGKVMYVMRNVSERVQLEKQLKASELRYRNLFEKAPLMVHTIDSDGRLLMVSDTWLEKLGYSRAEVIGRQAVDFLTEESRQQAADLYSHHFFKDEHIKNVPFTMVKKNGVTFAVLLTATLEKDSGGNGPKSFAVLIDLTDTGLLPRQAEDTQQ